jgi:hypothetical protein
VRFFRRRWDEDRGDEHADWGPSWWYFATDDDGIVREQAEVYDNGCVLLYDEAHIEDEFGSLSDVPLDFDELGPFEIDASAYARSVRGLVRRTG